MSVLAVIFRASYMCQREFCELRLSELTTFGTNIGHYKEALTKLEDKGIISKEQNGSLYRFTINEEKIMELANINNNYLKGILSRNCPKKGRERYQKSNLNVPEIGTENNDIPLYKAKIAIPKDREIQLNTLEQEKIDKLITFLKKQGHAYPKNYIMSLVKKYGIKPVCKLENINRYQWNEYLEYYSKK